MKWLISLALFLSSTVALAGPKEVDTQPTLIGGEVADPAKWPASVYVSMGNGRCSGTLVGEKVLLFAAHCVDDGKTATFTLSGTLYQGVCKHSPAYATDETSDWSLCLLSKAVPARPFEMVATSKEAYVCKKGEALRLTGFGCITPGGGGGNDGKFRIGEATVLQCPGNTHDLITKGAVALCFGDSGGALYKEWADGRRALVGVNSRGNIADTSYLVNTFDGAFAAWAAQWATINGVKICGLHSDAFGCRKLETPPPAPKPICNDKFEVVKAALMGLETCLKN